MENFELTAIEKEKYLQIKYLYEHPDYSKHRIAAQLGYSVRSINRWLALYTKALTEGKSGEEMFIHGNRGKQPACAIPQEIKEKIIRLYCGKYYDANFTHFTELLEKHEDIKYSVSTITAILEAQQIYSPRITKSKRKRIKKALKKLQKTTTSKREKEKIQNNLVALEDAHSRQPRKKYSGELIQMDASSKEWIPGQIWHLHIAVDNATGAIVGMWFDWQETLNGYYHVLDQMLSNFGIPAEIRTDNRTVFIYKSKKSSSLDEDAQTQFGYACKQLGIKLSCTSVPQAKGQVERMNATMQSRLPIELRLAGVSDIDSANEFLKSYLKEFNTKRARFFNGNKSVFVAQPPEEKKNLILAVITSRTVDQGHSIKFEKNYYRMIDKDGNQVHYTKGTKVTVIRAFNGDLYCIVNDEHIYALEVIPECELYSKEFDPQPQKEQKKPHVPSIDHPWKGESFRAYLRTRPYLSKEIIDSF